MLLRWHAQRNGKTNFADAATSIEGAIEHCVAKGQSTRDVGGNLGTRATGAAILAQLMA
jgi:3-isopropylmalate dehydrogenase